MKRFSARSGSRDSSENDTIFLSLDIRVTIDILAAISASRPCRETFQTISLKCDQCDKIFNRANDLRAHNAETEEHALTFVLRFIQGGNFLFILYFLFISRIP